MILIIGSKHTKQTHWEKLLSICRKLFCHQNRTIFSTVKDQNNFSDRILFNLLLEVSIRHLNIHLGCRILKKQIRKKVYKEIVPFFNEKITVSIYSSYLGH